MTSNGDFFLEFMEPLVGGMLDLIKGIGASLAKIFNIANYIDIINNNKGVSGFVVFISVICLLLLFGLICFLIYRIVRRIIRFRHNVSHQESLVEEIDNLNNDIANEVNALFMVDMAHIGGLVAAGVHPSPVPYADVVTSTTHKTLRGPRGAIILCKDELKKKINSAVFPGTQGGPLMHVIAGKAVCFKEALSEEFKAYQTQVVKNAAVLADTLSKGGIRLVSGGTDNHLILADTMSLGRTGMEVQELLDAAHITANKNSIPFDKQSVKLTSGMRFGTPAATTRGMAEIEMVEIGNMIVKLINEGDAAVADVKSRVIELCDKFPLYPGL